MVILHRIEMFQFHSETIMNPLHIPHIVELALSFLEDTKDLFSCRLASTSWYTHSTMALRKKHVQTLENGTAIGYFLDTILTGVKGRAAELRLVPVTKFKTSPHFFLSPDSDRIFEFLGSSMNNLLQSLEINFTTDFEHNNRASHTFSQQIGSMAITFPRLTHLTLIYSDEAEIVIDAWSNPFSKLFKLLLNNSPNLESIDMQIWGSAEDDDGDHNDVLVALFREIISSNAISPKLKSLQICMDVEEEYIRELDHKMRKRKVLLKSLSLRTVGWLYLPIGEEDEDLFLSLLQPHKNSLERLDVDNDFRDISELPVFPKIHTLSLQIRRQGESFKFLKGFPNLKLLSILSTVDYLDPPPPNLALDHLWQPPLASCREHVRVLSTPFVGHINMSRMITLFPNLKTLSFVANPIHAYVVRRVFAELLSLEELMLQVSYRGRYLNPDTPKFTMDSILSGLGEDTCREILASYDYDHHGEYELLQNHRDIIGPRNVGITNLRRLRKLYITNTGIHREEDLDYGHRHETPVVTDVGVTLAILQMMPTLKECRIMEHCLSQKCIQLLKDAFGSNIDEGICRHCFVQHCTPFLCSVVI